MKPSLKSPMRSLLGILVASLVLPLAIFIGVSAYDRGRILENARDSLGRTADMLHEHALRMLEIQDLVIRQVDRRIAGMTWDEIARSEDLHHFLRDLDYGLENVDSIWVTSPQGVTVVGSRMFPSPMPDITHREHFITLRDGDPGIVISRAFQESVTKQTVFAIARRRTTADGRFDGLVAVSVRADLLLRLYREVAPKLNHSVGLIRKDGVFLVRDAAVPPPDDAQQLASQYFRRAAAEADSGTFDSVSAVDGVPRIVAYRKVGNYPLYIVLAVGTDAVLSIWRQHVLILGLLCGGAALSLSLMTLLALRQSGRERAALVRLEREAARRETAEAALRQSQKLEAIGKLTGGIAHDFNNLLTAVIGSLETVRARLRGGGGGGGDLAGPIDIALQGANRAATLTQRLLAFARQQPLNPRAEDLNALVTGMVPLLRRSMTESTVLETELCEGVWLASCDRVQMETALLNLAINARDAMPGPMSGPMSDGGRLRIRTENVTLDAAAAAAFGELSPGDYVRLSVSDTGTGMPEDVRARAFDPFFTTKPVGQGTGLGLSQVYGIVRQSGGDARILSVPGEGTTVEICLPRHVATATETPVAEAPPEPDRQPAPDMPVDGAEDGPPRILLVEDEAIVRFVAVEALRGAGYDVEEAEDATAALAIIEASKPFHLMVTDVGLPGLNGRQLAEIAQRQQPRLKVIYVTGYAGIATDAAFEPGTLLLPKPFTPDALIHKVGRTLAGNSAAA